MPSEPYVKVTVAWWLMPYFYVLAAMSAITGREPDWDKVTYWIDRALTAKIVTK